MNLQMNTSLTLSLSFSAWEMLALPRWQRLWIIHNKHCTKDRNRTAKILILPNHNKEKLPKVIHHYKCSVSSVFSKGLTCSIFLRYRVLLRLRSNQERIAAVIAVVIQITQQQIHNVIKYIWKLMSYPLMDNQNVGECSPLVPRCVGEGMRAHACVCAWPLNPNMVSYTHRTLNLLC